MFADSLTFYDPRRLACTFQERDKDQKGSLFGGKKDCGGCGGRGWSPRSWEWTKPPALSFGNMPEAKPGHTRTWATYSWSLPPALFFFGIRMKQAGCTYLGRFKKKVPVVGWVKAAGCTLKGNPQKGCGEDLGKAPSILASRGGF